MTGHLRRGRGHAEPEAPQGAAPGGRGRRGGARGRGPRQRRVCGRPEPPRQPRIPAGRRSTKIISGFPPAGRPTKIQQLINQTDDHADDDADNDTIHLHYYFNFDSQPEEGRLQPLIFQY